MRKHHRVLIIVLVLLALGVVWRVAHGSDPAGPPARTPPPPPPPAAAHAPFPRPVQYAPPVYPRAAREAGVQGTVWVQVLIDQAGRVVDARISRGIPGLDVAALATVRRWIFESRMPDGRPSPAAFEVPVRFTLHGDGEPQRDGPPAAAPPPPGKPPGDETIAPYPDPRGPGGLRGGHVPPVDELPTVIRRVAPKRTAEMRRASWRGTLVVRALVGRDGRVSDARVSPARAGFDSSAITAVKQWRFKPARSNGGPVEAWVAVPVRF